MEFDNNQKIEFPKYPLLIDEKISEDLYTDTYRYIFEEKHKLNISRYPHWVRVINPKNEEKYNKYYLHKNNKLCGKIRVNAKEKKFY